MRIRRLRLRHYRGILDREIHFASIGVTLVVGPNEIGKSSLAESLDLLFDELDSTAKQSVRAVKPVDRDEATEIEAEVETGPYRFTYSKRFHRRPATSLRVSEPAVENWTGREAHDRAQAILSETVDVDLWRALRIQQGEGLRQPALGEQPALAAALDQAAGRAASGTREETLYDAAFQEYARYFTPTGRVRREIAEAEAVALRQREAAQAKKADLAALEADVARERELVRALEALARSERESVEASREQEALRSRVEALRGELRFVETQRSAALSAERDAVQATAARAALLGELADATAEGHGRGEERAEAEPERAAALEAYEDAERHEAGTRSGCEMARQAAQQARSELERIQLARELAEAREGLRRVDAALSSAAEAERVLAGRVVDERRLRAIQEALLAMERARARVEAEGPLVRVQPETQLEARIDAREERLACGATREVRVAEALELSLPGVVRLEVLAGAGAAARLKTLEENEARLRTLCEECDLADAEDAMRAHETYRAARRTLEERDRVLAAALGGETREALRARLGGLEERIARCAEPPSATPQPSELETARSRVREAESALAEAETLHREAEALRTARAARLRECDRAHDEAALRLELAREAQLAAERRLEAARSQASDAQLDEQRAAAADAARQAEARSRATSEQLAALEPDAVNSRARALDEALLRTRREIEAARSEQIALRERLALRGEEGLKEQVDDAETRALRAERDVAQRARRAAAARCLFETLHAEREAARRRYAEPLRARIEALGRPVFGSSFQVELDDSLRIANRALDGVKLAHDQLSAGAREQLSLLARLACAEMVAEAGGVPIILDDALGHSDPTRLRELGAVLSRAGASVQLIVLTCAPERYLAVRDARRVELT